MDALTQPVGLLPELTVQQRSVALTPGDAVVIFSDGLPDALGESGEELGDERLMDVLLDLPRSGAEEFCRAALDAVENFSRGHKQADDLTLIVALASR